MKSKTLSFFLLSVLMSTSQAFADGSARTVQCAPQTEDESTLAFSDFHWGYTLPEMLTRFDEIYDSGKRLPGRAYFDPSEDRYFIDMKVSGAKTKRVSLPAYFIQNVTRHIEEALRLKYAHAIFFPDMGHSHFFIPTEIYDEKIRPLPGDKKDVIYQTMISEPRLKVLYHTAEQLTTVPFKGTEPQFGSVTDPVMLWRYFTRNVIGENSGNSKLEVHLHAGSGYNTVRELKGHSMWSGGFSISASREGCFPYYDGKQTRYFDLSLQDLD